MVRTCVIHFRGEVCTPQWFRYSNHWLGLQLLDSAGMPYAKASVMLASSDTHGFTITPDEMVLKPYAENAGMLEALVAAGLVEDTGRRLSSTYVEFPVVRVIEDFDG